MSASYSPDQITALDRIRFALGDTDVSDDPDTSESNALKPDEEYLAVIDRASGEDEATAIMAEALAAQVAQSPSSYSESGASSVSWNDRVKTWLQLAASIRARLALAAGTTGGASRSVNAVRPRGSFDCEYGARSYDPLEWSRWGN